MELCASLSRPVNIPKSQAYRRSKLSLFMDHVYIQNDHIVKVSVSKSFVSSKVVIRSVFSTTVLQSRNLSWIKLFVLDLTFCDLSLKVVGDLLAVKITCTNILNGKVKELLISREMYTLLGQILYIACLGVTLYCGVIINCINKFKSCCNSTATSIIRWIQSQLQSNSRFLRNRFTQQCMWQKCPGALVQYFGLLMMGFFGYILIFNFFVSMLSLIHI